MTILVVDDEPEFRIIMRSVLRAEGMDVILAEHGQEALEKLKETKFDLVITDIYMPVMDGIKLHRAVRAMPEFEKLPFLFVSAYDDQHTVEAVKDPRYEGFFRKAKPVPEMMAWIQYLTTPEERRPRMPPSGSKSKSKEEPRPGVRGGSRTPIL